MVDQDIVSRDYKRLTRSQMPIDEVPHLEADLEDLLNKAPSAAKKTEILMSFGMSSYQDGRFDEAFNQFYAAFETSGDTQALVNSVVCARKGKAGPKMAALEKKALNHAQKLEDSEKKAEIYDALCHNAGNQNRVVTAAKLGRESLRIKDAIQGAGVKLIDRERPVFNFEDRQRNIISFSLFGDQERYTRVSIENAKAIQYVYPGWTCRYTVDQSVPIPVLDQLSSLGAQIHISPELHDPKINSGLFWRFGVASDPKVDFFLVRDADSLINVREKVAVDEWIASDCDFHVMRDFYTHSELILAGLWGGVAGRIPDIEGEIADWHKKWPTNQVGVHNHDQLFLRKHIWPTIKTSLMQHDSAFMGDGTRKFPKVGTMHPIRHVGQDMGIFLTG